MKKKSSGRSSVIAYKDKSKSTLDEIQKKLSNSSALNGGFETLLYKIDKIEQSQGQLVNKVDKIHDAIYDPSDGIFSKLSEYKLENAEQLSDMSQEGSELHLWKENREKEEQKEVKKSDIIDKKIDDIEKSVDNLMRNKHNTWAIMKWFLVAFGGGIVTLTIKWIETKFH
jgi:DnaJ-domain-containing protein 1